ncbi:hypothetical protein VI08_12250 [Luteibacter yeojuensis]|uniref:Uncharacterized protein n=2 Tax=Luteibacter yeojuensis TaxID=345309 RepID=A0A0F3KNE0_9GAMM|nr:hypothetical protein VI08_12250 [Luteibacter yeojuensis]
MAILVMSAIHFSLFCVALAYQIACEDHAWCASSLRSLALNVLSFPLGLVLVLVQAVGADESRIWPGGAWLFDLLLPLNSVLAAMFIWYLIKAARAWKRFGEP